MDNYKTNNLYAAEEWEVIFNSFRNISLKAFDYDTVYNTLINYIKTNNPEEFDSIINNRVMSIHLDMLSRLSQSISYRYEQGIRENYFDTATLKESVIKLAKAFSYKPKRNRGANGLCRIGAIRTTEPVFDENGNDISNQTIRWNQSGDANWLDKFQRIINQALTPTNQFGRPIKRETIYNIRHEIYGIERSSTTQSAYRFNAPVNGTRYDFEAVSANTDSGLVVEESPDFFSEFKILYKNDGNGNFSNDTGFFVLTKEGSLQYNNVAFDVALADRTYNIASENINETDLWVYELDENNRQDTLWSSVSNLRGQSVDYEKIFNRNTKLYSIESLENDRVSLMFGDGMATDIPKGNFRIWYRTSRNEYFNVKAREIFEQPVQIPYVGSDGQTYNITLFLTNLNEISNSEPTETISQIKRNAPLTHYTQDRMINAEDYNIYPQTKSSLIKKLKTVNRTHPGHSRYMDIYDLSGEISYVTINADDGYFYKEDNYITEIFDVTFTTNYENELSTIIDGIVTDENFNNYVYSDIITQSISINDNVKWKVLPNSIAGDRGYFSINNIVVPIGKDATINSLKTLSDDSILLFNDNGFIKHINILSMVNNGLVNPNIDSIANIRLDEFVSDDSELIGTIPTIRNILNDEEKNIFSELMRDEIDFDIYYDFENDAYTTSIGDLSVLIAEFSFDDDSSFGVYAISYSITKYIISSDNDVRFFIKPTSNLIDPATLLTIQDSIIIDGSNVDESTKSDQIIGRTSDYHINYLPI